MLGTCFAMLDASRRMAGRLLDVHGLGFREIPWHTLRSWPGARLRGYGNAGRSAPVLLIIQAPFKSPAIWDIRPDVSVVKAALDRGTSVFLLEWLIPGEAEKDYGLSEYALALPEAAAEAVAVQTGRKPVLAGHSLGGTFAAILAALRTDLVDKLILIDAPLVFGTRGGPLAAAVRNSLGGRHIVGAFGSPVPGVVINMLSSAAVPEAFIWQRWHDFFSSLASPAAFDLHLRVERWAMEELPMPHRLFGEVAEDLYRCDHFHRGGLRLRREVARLEELRVPTLAVVNPAGRVVPPGSVTEGLRASSCEWQVLDFEPEPGPMLQHLGPLVAPAAHHTLWPPILTWLAQKC